MRMQGRTYLLQNEIEAAAWRGMWVTAPKPVMFNIFNCQYMNAAPESCAKVCSMFFVCGGEPVVSSP